jgi:predicted transcriptional regulator
VGRKKTVCVYVDSELVEEMTKTAEAQGVSLSWLIEDAVRLYVTYLLRRPEPQARRARRATSRQKPHTESTYKEPTPVAKPSEPPPYQSASAPLPPHLLNNVWISILRSRS